MDGPLRGSDRRWNMPVTKDQADMLATLATACRPNGAPRWDTPGIVAAIAKIRHMRLTDVALAVIRAADDRDNRTPGVIANTRSTCWQERGTNQPRELEVLSPDERCGVCSEREDRCRAMWGTDHTFEADFKRGNPAEALALITAALKAEIQPTTPPQPRKTLDDYVRDPRAVEARNHLGHHTDTESETP